jgi:hypothetical protein
VLFLLEHKPYFMRKEVSELYASGRHLFPLCETVESSNKLLFSACVQIANRDDHDSDNLLHATFVFVFNSKHLRVLNTSNIRVPYEVENFSMR